MIHDTLNNSAKYETLHPNFKTAFDFLKNTDFSNLSTGKIDIDGDIIFATHSITKGIQPEDSKVEIHKKYIDIQMPLTAPETMGWISAEILKDLAVPDNEEKDIAFYNEKATDYVSIYPREFAVFFPEDGHQPCIGTGEIRKIIVKILARR
jgi:YhcH/YjgK/YiaL family protein